MEEILKRLEAAEATIKRLESEKAHEECQRQLEEQEAEEAHKAFDNFIKERQRKIDKEMADAEELKKRLI